MKTLRIAMIAAAVVAFSMTGIAGNDGVKTTPLPKLLHLTFEQAMQRPDLVIQMYIQLNDDFLNKYQFIYTVKVYYKGRIVYVTGTYDQWRMFFRTKWRESKEKISINTDD